MSVHSAPLPWWALPAALIVFLLAFLVVNLRLEPPAAVPADAPAGEFSAQRARAVLVALAGDGSPHPAGTLAEAQVRQRVVAAFERLGYVPRQEKGFGCWFGRCSTVYNVVAELPGRERGSALLLCAHYDSVSAGPGISDDLAGTAALLEVARILKSGPPPRNSVLFLINGGEEAGLLGATTFAESSPEMARVRAVVNLEARGTSGPSLLFETGRENRGSIALLTPHLERPVASSLFQTLYEYLPNDTDFSIFKRRNLGGFNFAYIGDAAQYHSGFDNLANLSTASLQHHGDNALASVRALAAADLARTPRGSAVFFDLLASRLIWWPSSWGPVLGAVALLLIAVAIVLLRRRGLLGAGSLALGVAAWCGTVVVALALGFALSFVLRLTGALQAPWPARSLPPQAAFWLAALAGAALLALRRAGFFGLWAGAWLCWAVVGLVLALVAPGASYLFLVPALLAGVLGPALLAGGGGRTVAALLPGLAAALLWFPVLLLIYDGLGTPMLWLIGTLMAAALTSVLPLLGGAGPGWRRGISATAVLCSVVMLIWMVASPAYSAAAPQRMNLLFHQDADTGRARWIVSAQPPLPPAMRQVAPFGPLASIFPWTDPARGFLAGAAPLPLPPPELTVLLDTPHAEQRHLRLRLASRRGAPTAGLIFPMAAIATVAVGGRDVTLPPVRPGDNPWQRVEMSALPAQGIEIDLVLASGAGKTWEGTVYDRTPGLPPTGARLLAARPETAAPVQDGDATLVTRKVRL